jgi:chromosome segregation ATPase
MDFEQEKKLRGEIDALKNAQPDTRVLIREATSLIFFRYGETPTANGLYQLLRKGSMTTYTDELRRFWKDMRDRTEVRISQPEIPSALLERTGGLLSELWTLAQQAATESLGDFRREADRLVDEAREQTRVAQLDNDRLKLKVDETDRSLLALSEAKQSIEKLLAELTGRHDELRLRFDETLLEKQQAEEELENIRMEYEDRTASMQKSWDNEKELAAKEQSRLEQLLTSTEETIKRLRVDIQREVDRSESMRIEFERTKAEKDQMRSELNEIRYEYSHSREVNAGKLARLDMLEEKMARIRRPAPASRRRAKRIAK